MTTYLPPRAQLSAGLLVASRQWQRLADQAFGEFGLSSACTGPLPVSYTHLTLPTM